MAICLCQGKYPGCTHGMTCNQIAGGGHSPHFCLDCDGRRIIEIDRIFDKFGTVKTYVPRHAKEESDGGI